MRQAEPREEKEKEPEPARLLTIPEAARVLAVPESWLREKVRLRRVPHRRLGKHVRFSTGDLEQIVARATQQVAPTRRTLAGWPHTR